MSPRPRIVLTSRELFPFGGGGIGTYIAQTARVLAPVADVTILTASWYRDAHTDLTARGDARVDYGGAEVAFVEIPEKHEYGGFYAHMHLYAHRVLERLHQLFAGAPPDLVEFPDYLGEGFVATQARTGGDPFLRDTLLALRLHTSAEMCEVLNGHLERDFERRISRQLERRTLRDADVLLHAGGDILGAYTRFYAGQALAPAVRVRHPLDLGDDTTDHTSPPDAPPDPGPQDGPLRMLCVGRLERRKGVQDLVEALTALDSDWRLTLLGADTPTAPLGRSMRRTLELQAAGDHRIAFADAVPRAQLPALMAAHDVLVMPSRWECWPYVALEGMAAGVPVVAPRVGGLAEIVEGGVTGRHVAAPRVPELIEALEPLVADPPAARARFAREDVRARARALTDPDAIRAAYLDLLDRPRAVRGHRARPAADPLPLVTVVIPYYGMRRYVAETVASVFAQTYPRLEVLVVDDGSFAEEDVVLAELATRHPLQVLSRANGGLGAARNFGIGQARGRYVLPLDADNVLEPEFVARCVDVLETQEDVAFVTSWNRYIAEDGTPFAAPNEGYRPVGNWTAIVHERNVAGDGTAVLRRSVFDRHRYSEDLVSFEDWALYRELHDAGVHGHVIPEMLWRYRVRDSSMLREVGLQQEQRLHEEMDALIAEREVAWVSTNG